MQVRTVYTDAEHEFVRKIPADAGGIVDAIGRAPELCGSIPAYVGVTIALSPICGQYWDYPRIAGGI